MLSCLADLQLCSQGVVSAMCMQVLVLVPDVSILRYTMAFCTMFYDEPIDWHFMKAM